MFREKIQDTKDLLVPLQDLAKQLSGELHYDELMRTLFATDASAYREMPLAVAFPKNQDDLAKLITFANTHHTSLIPRAAGTSLAGQVVGHGIVVDISRYFTEILEVNPKENWVRVQPGVVRDELNAHLKSFKRFFAPETSTANRAMIGGMIGNNSCGANSIVYGSTREHLLEVKALLSDGSEVLFENLSLEELKAKSTNNPDSLEGQIYQQVFEMLSHEENRAEIKKEFPKESIPRRNTGYALDLLMDAQALGGDSKKPFNFSKLIAGSEGTLCFITEAKLKMTPMPPPEIGLLCGHFQSVDEALRANLVALSFQPSACELMDHYILECTKSNIEQRQNRFFVKDDPGAILVVEFRKNTLEEVEKITQELQAAWEKQKLGYHFPLVKGEDTKRVWSLRKAGLGLLSNIPGDAKPAPVIEDTAVDVIDLPDYIADFNKILDKYNLSCVHYAHAGSGELHLRPILNLKTPEGNQQFRIIAEEIAQLVKKYQGSLSGEHGDGRLRGEFLQFMIGEKNYELVKQIKTLFDPKGIFNPNKIVNTPPMNTQLRYEPGQKTPEIPTLFDFSKEQGILRAAEMCNGSGDCRKTEITGGTMCPSYMATRHEKDTTRARANILREVLTNSHKSNPFDSKEIYEIMDLCLSCKGCKSECPSNVDIGKMKAEFLQQYYRNNFPSLRTRMIANFATVSWWASRTPWLYNFIFKTPALAKLFKKWMGFAEKRSIPFLYKMSMRRWYSFPFRKYILSKENRAKRQVYLFCDEFTNYNDTEMGIKALKLLDKLGYQPFLPVHTESGRAPLSKGLVKKARRIAKTNVKLLRELVTKDIPLVGIEPSAILTFRDEYLELVPEKLKEDAQKLAKNTFMIDEFIAQEIDKGHITAEQFTDEPRLIKLHGHCHQKALASLTPTKKILSLPKNYKVHLIPSGCCGMAGSFGYEKEHYDLSMKIGELVLFPTIRKQDENIIIAAPGTSCRHQIKDGTGRIALHPLEILWDALKK